ncbi:50S ribosomal protein L2 [Patescibacteria group bacterium]|nr:50S ribosomal protein L2 [Patescibacteria group bacterium]
MKKNKKIKSLLKIKKKKSGRDASGQISVRHQGGEHKRFLRKIDWRRDKTGIKAKVVAIEYDPNRTADIALLSYTDGSKSYILAPKKLKAGDFIISSSDADIKEGNCLPVGKIPAGVPFHCLEIRPGKGAQFVKSAGSAAYIQSIDGQKAIIKLPSGELRLFNINCKATIGQLSRPDLANIKLKKAGDKRHRGVRPTVRGVAQHPDSHPHGGGEGKSSIGMHPKTPWGKPTLGKKTRKKKKQSNKLIIKRIN